MAKNPKTSSAARDRGLDAEMDALNGGFMDIYDGIQPAGPATAVTTQIKLVRLPLGNPAFSAASGGSKTASAITPSAALANGTPAWLRLVTSGDIAVQDGSVGVADQPAPGDTYDCLLPLGTLVAGITVSVSSLVVTQAAG